MSVPPPNVKVYDRPENKSRTPIIIVIALVVVAIAGFFVFKAMHPDATTSPTNVRPGVFVTPLSLPLTTDRSACPFSFRREADAPIHARAVS